MRNSWAFCLGTIAFLRSISLEAVGLGVHLAAGAHDILLQAEYILTSIPPSVKVRHKTKSNVRSNQPKDAQEGLKKVNPLYLFACFIFQFLTYRKITRPSVCECWREVKRILFLTNSYPACQNSLGPPNQHAYPVANEIVDSNTLGLIVFLWNRLKSWPKTSSTLK